MASAKDNCPACGKPLGAGHTCTGTPVGQPRDYGVLLRKERRAVERDRRANFWTFLKRTEVPWPVVLLVGLALAFLAGCGSDRHSSEPIYLVEAEMLKDATSWCFGNGDVDYFTMQDNEPELLVCKDGRTVKGVWYTP
jgi:hypothetical protein